VAVSAEIGDAAVNATNSASARSWDNWRLTDIERLLSLDYKRGEGRQAA
jgi:hypothetical protein